jgi:glucose-1-phosphate adenylyltransferase
MNNKRRTLGMILAGGQGTRLAPLTAKRSKPAVPFGSKFRIIDFALSNFLNSGVYSVYVLTQFKAQSLTEHIQRGWRFGSGLLADYFITLVPAQMYLYEELGPVWYRGTADAIYQNLHLVENYHADDVAIFSGDHIYKMNVAHMLEQHEATGADITIAAYPTPLAEAHRFGVMQVNPSGRITDFQEKVKNPPPIPDKPTHALASMGNYIFKRGVLSELLELDAKTEGSQHDFGKDVLPRALRDGYHIHAYDFHSNPIPGQTRANTYWRDVGTLEAYHEASMDLVSADPEFDVFNPDWPLRTAVEFSPPAKFVHESGERMGHALDSMVAGGSIISGGTVRKSILSRRVRVNSYSLVERSVLFDEVDIGRHAQVKNAIIDKGVRVPPHAKIGFDLAQDKARGFTVTDSGIVVVPKNYRFE